MPYGVVEIALLTDDPGDTVNFTIYLPEPAPEGYTWYRFDGAAGWADFSRHVAFNAERDRATFAVTDGGECDDDGSADRSFRAPLALGNVANDDPPAQDATGGGSGSGGGCFVETALQQRPPP